MDYIATDAELVDVASAIRQKSGTYSALEWPDGFVDAIRAIKPSQNLYWTNLPATSSTKISISDLPAEPSMVHISLGFSLDNYPLDAKIIADLTIFLDAKPTKDSILLRYITRSASSTSSGESLFTRNSSGYVITFSDNTLSIEIPEAYTFRGVFYTGSAAPKPYKTVCVC